MDSDKNNEVAVFFLTEMFMKKKSLWNFGLFVSETCFSKED